ncbi:hypothetical protein CAPTEDRAFT_212624 [Capitella teleta]|uniref:Uncharacterized protein n=1 Tax=Capitella teleta TaxID=283909 RepID=R7V8N3_CAPTE|nr:hypothetical protein CAPTEDRAFT_212624 [Capitella teleta]|eukprot:ELU14877.1 hypothetical protein CAPTEDRAFT_212624 [Capitella teleta]
MNERSGSLQEIRPEAKQNPEREATLAKHQLICLKFKLMHRLYDIERLHCLLSFHASPSQGQWKIDPSLGDLGFRPGSRILQSCKVISETVSVHLSDYRRYRRVPQTPDKWTNSSTMTSKR